MTSRLLLASLALSVGPLGSWLTSLPQQTQASALQSGWSVGLRVQRPFLQVGEVLQVQGDLSNFSRQDAYGFVPITGGNGCTFWTTIQDFAGNVVWQPGTLIGGTYQGPGCTFGTTYFELTRRSERLFEVDVPLIYQNPGGFGVQGEDLPPGVYTVHMEMRFGGPNHSPFDPPGQVATASVPVRIE
jgi:hypothetical protein